MAQERLDSMITEERWSPKDYQSVLQTMKPVLKIHIECPYGLIDEIISNNIIPEEELKNIRKCHQNRLKQNDKLLETLCQQSEVDQYDKFLLALLNTNQGHLAKLITHRGDFKSLGDDRPLSEKERLKLRALRKLFIAEISLAGLLNGLYAASCISVRQKASIEQPKPEADQISELCEVLERRSYAQYKIFVNCCKETDQKHVAGAIEAEGVVLIADVTVESSFGHESLSIDEEIVDCYKKSPEKHSSCFQQLLNVLYVKLMGMRVGRSIRLYLNCSTVDAFEALCELAQSEQLKSIIASFFNKLCDGCFFEPVTLSELNLVNRSACDNYFDAVDDQDMSIQFSKSFTEISQRLGSIYEYQERLKRTQSMLGIYLECQYGLLDQIVTFNILSERQLDNVKEYQRNRSKQNDQLLHELCQQKEYEPYENFLVALKNTNQEHLAKCIIHVGDITSLGDDRPLSLQERLKLRALRQYFIDQICLREVLPLLLAKNCLSARQLSSINQPVCTADQISELCEILERRNYAQYKIFVDCCRETHQDHIALEIIESGVVVIADVVLESPTRQSIKIEEEVVQKCNPLIRENVNGVANHCLRVRDTKLLGLQTKHSIRLYIHCSTVHAFNTLCQLVDSGQLKPNIEQFFNKLCHGCDFEPVILRELYFINRDSCQKYFNVGKEGKEEMKTKNQIQGMIEEEKYSSVGEHSSNYYSYDSDESDVSMPVNQMLSEEFDTGKSDAAITDESEPVGYDAFISHCSVDRKAACAIKERLQQMDFPEKERKFRIWTHEDDIPFGASMPEALGRAIYNSKRFVMLVSPDLFKTDWCLMEQATAQVRENELGKVFCILVLYNMAAEALPDHMRHIACLDYNDAAFYDKLFKALTNDVPLTNQIEVNKIGVGLAWSYFYGYLNIILPGLQDRIRGHETWNNAYSKFLIVMPHSCKAPSSIADLDPNFVHQGRITLKESKAGNVDRNYSSTVYKFTYTSTASGEPKEEVQYLLMEFAMPLYSLYKMANKGLATLDANAMRHERDMFRRVTEQILNYPKVKNTCRGKCLIVDFQDVDFMIGTTVQPAQTLSEAVWNALCRDKLLDRAASGRLPRLEQDQPAQP